jgi:hypothetical protein
MRKAACYAMTAVAALSACKREPSFDERYASAQKAIQQKAGELDQDLVKRASEAAAIEPQGSQSATETPQREI